MIDLIPTAIIWGCAAWSIALMLYGNRQRRQADALMMDSLRRLTFIDLYFADMQKWETEAMWILQKIAAEHADPDVRQYCQRLFDANPTATLEKRKANAQHPA